MNVSFRHAGKVYDNFSPEDAVLAGVPESTVKQALLDQAWAIVRDKRDRLIAKTDYAVTIDYPLTDAQKAEVMAYRKALRDIPETADDPDAIEWPEKPEVLA